MGMWYWNQQKFEGLKSIVEFLNQSKSADGFRTYCDLLEKGFRKKALSALDGFISETKAWPEHQRRDFVDWLLWVQLSLPEVHGLIPHTLQKKMVDPTLCVWKMDEPTNPRALRWSEDILDVRKAITIDGKDHIARTKFGVMVLKDSDYTTHELPYGFLGDDPYLTLSEVAEAQEYLQVVKEDKVVIGVKEGLKRVDIKLRSYLSME